VVGQASIIRTSPFKTVYTVDPSLKNEVVFSLKFAAVDGSGFMVRDEPTIKLFEELQYVVAPNGKLEQASCGLDSY
jgi:hypothetical protein